MFKTLFSIGIMTMVGIVALKLAFGLFGGLLAIFWVLFWLALKILLVGAVIYFLIRLISPNTARKMTDSVNDSTPS